MGTFTGIQSDSLNQWPDSLEDAIVQTVAYSDVFQYPLKVEEIHRYLIRWRVTLDKISEALSDPRLTPGRLTRIGDYYTLPGREGIVETRLRRAHASAVLWEKAIFWGRRIASLPFVRMIAVTGALSMDNSEAGDDLDYLIVTEPDRLWLCRGMVIALVRLAARQGDVICPNYFVSERALVVKEHNLYTAHEMAQMVPLTGYALYQRMRELNSWVEEWLPNAGGLPRPIPLDVAHTARWRPLAEAFLRTPLGGWLERSEMQRKLKKLSQQGAASANPEESEFGRDWCKGHFHAHGQQTVRALSSRLQELGH